MTALLALAAIALCTLGMWYVVDYLPEARRRAQLLRDLRAKIEAVFGTIFAPVEPCTATDMHVIHTCGDDLEELCAAALTYASTLAWEYPCHDLRWCNLPTFHVCEEDGVRRTCLYLRFHIVRVPEVL